MASQSSLITFAPVDSLVSSIIKLLSTPDCTLFRRQGHLNTTEVRPHGDVRSINWRQRPRFQNGGPSQNWVPLIALRRPNVVRMRQLLCNQFDAAECRKCLVLMQKKGRI